MTNLMTVLVVSLALLCSSINAKKTIITAKKLASSTSKANNQTVKGALVRQPGWRETLDSTSTSKQIEQSGFLNTLLNDYDMRILPSVGGDPVLVDAAIFVNILDSITEDTQEYDIGIFLRLTWQDSRLAFNQSVIRKKSITLDSSMAQSIWRPELRITNARKAFLHSVPSANILLQLNSKGNILYSSRLYMTVSCQMRLQTFPFDSQHCPLIIESCSLFFRLLSKYKFSLILLMVVALPTNQLILAWAEWPLEMRELIVPHFTLSSVKFEDDLRESSLGNFSRIVVSFHIYRDLGFYVLQIYIPSLLTVATAFTSFWIDPLAVPGRINIGVFTTFIMSNMALWLGNIVPRVSYIKAIDVWILVCTLFVFATFVEYAAVNVILRQKRARCRLGTLVFESANVSGIIAETGRLDDDDVLSPDEEENILLPQSRQHQHHQDPFNSTIRRGRRGGQSIKAIRRVMEVMSDDARVLKKRRNFFRFRRFFAPSIPDRTFYYLSGFERCELVESICRRVVPTTFVIFAVIYWLVYCYLLQERDAEEPPEEGEGGEAL